MTGMEWFDICDEEGRPAGQVIERKEAHRKGILHRTAHVWITEEKNGRTMILLQKRSRDKDSFPGMYDTSSAGHIRAGDEPLPSALRELAEELGIEAGEKDLSFAGTFRIRYEETFYGELFSDNEVVFMYVLEKPVDIRLVKVQESEVEEVRWFGLDEVTDAVRQGSDVFCVPIEGLELLRSYLESRKR